MWVSVSDMKRYIRIYIRLLHLNFSSLLAYRANFVNSFISSIVWGAFSIISILLLTSRTSSLFGWSRHDIILLTCSYSIFIGVFHTFLSRNFEHFSRIVDLGELDTLLIKPMDSQFYISFRYVNYPSIIRIVVGIILVSYLLKGEAVTLTQVLGYGAMMFFGLITLYSLWYIITAFTIWLSRLSNIVEFLYTITGVSRFPPQMYSEFSWYLFLFLFPLTLIIATPTKFLLNTIDMSSIATLIVTAGVLFILSRLFWRFALRFYTSASS